MAANFKWRSNPNIVAERERNEANCEADNAWLKSAGWGEI